MRRADLLVKTSGLASFVDLCLLGKFCGSSSSCKFCGCVLICAALPPKLPRPKQPLPLLVKGGTNQHQI